MSRLCIRYIATVIHIINKVNDKEILKYNKSIILEIKESEFIYKNKSINAYQ
jgi:hypothetical protein